MNGLTTDQEVLAICAGGDAYRTEMITLERKRIERENKN